MIANKDVNLTIDTGEIVGLLGENGAGKSTLMNILYGLYSATSGEILVDGEVVRFLNHRRRNRGGNRDGPPALHAGSRLHCRRERGSRGRADFGARRHLGYGRSPTGCREISVRYGLDVDPDAITEDLPIGIQQRVEIIKVLFRDAEILVFDEPTAVLTPQEVEDFFKIIRQLQADGKGIVFITHKLKEIQAIADRVAVLRRGEIVGEAKPSELTANELAELMVGRPVDLTVDKTRPSRGTTF